MKKVSYKSPNGYVKVSLDLFTPHEVWNNFKASVQKFREEDHHLFSFKIIRK